MSPDCVAWIVHAPPAMIVTVVPETVQTDVVCELKATVNPDDAVAATVKGAVPNGRSDSTPKVMLCAPLEI